MNDFELLDFPDTTAHDVGQITNLEEFYKDARKVFEVKYNKRLHYKATLSDFELLNMLGSGSFGRVVLGKHSSGKLYAIKILEKKLIIRGKQIEHTLNEKKILESVRFPFVVHLECFFQDNSYIYFTLPFIICGEMFSHIRKFGKFNESLAKFYAAQVLLGLEYLHYLDLAYRDLKPENILIDAGGFIRISDFGFCKRVTGRTYTLCGTPEYLAPEIIMSKGYGRSVDWWSFGILVYEMCAGYPPFYAKDHLKLYEKIVIGKYKTASHFSTDLVDLLQNILQVDLTKRFGNLKGGIDDIKVHGWFKYVDWVDLVNFQVEVPYVPYVKDENDLSYFDTSSEDELVLRINKNDIYARDFETF